ncbi:MAG TPA: hypothetical protein VGL78_01245 [Solirubrobacteraceae bacterium]
MRARRALIAVCVIAAASLLSACGEHTMHNADANNNGTFINAGNVIYQLQISRELNQYSPEDKSYFIGLPKNAAKLTASQLWFGVFLWARNQTNNNRTTTDNFDIVDTQGNTYRPLKLDSATNPYAWTSTPLTPGATQPNPNTTAGVGPTGGELLLFKLNTSIYNNRPLALQIRAPSGNKVWATISLDL